MVRKLTIKEVFELYNDDSFYCKACDVRADECKFYLHKDYEHVNISNIIYRDDTIISVDESGLKDLILDYLELRESVRELKQKLKNL